MTPPKTSRTPAHSPAKDESCAGSPALRSPLAPAAAGQALAREAAAPEVVTLASQASPSAGASEGHARAGGGLTLGEGGGDGPPSPGHQSRAWRLELPAGMELLNANHRSGHWGRRQRLTMHLRAAAGWKARQLKIPRLERAHVLGIYEPPDHRHRDPANLYPSFKACIDGIVEDAGVLANDDAAHLDGPDMRLGPVHPRGRLVLIVTELPGSET